MNDTLTQALSLLIGAITTTILMAASFYFGPGADRNRQHGEDIQDRRQHHRESEDRLDRDDDYLEDSHE